MELAAILKVATRGGASDIILRTGSVPKFRFNGELVPLSDGTVITEETMQRWIEAIVPPNLRNKINLLEDLDFSLQTVDKERFRVNVFRQRGVHAMVMRVIKQHIRTLEELQLPAIIGNIALEKRGLVLVTGATGSGKSTTLAAMIQKINQEKSSHIITIEDPIEFHFTDRRSMINQREVGIDTPSFDLALRSALRQNPDVILVGELRDRETVETAVNAAETGHLVMSTLHTSDAIESLTRIMSFFPPHQHRALSSMLSANLKAIVSQRLVPRNGRHGMVSANEILIVNSTVREIINSGENFSEIKEAIREGSHGYGMQSFDQALFNLYKHGAISREEAINQASQKDDMRLLISGIAS